MGTKYGSIHVKTRDSLQIANTILESFDGKVDEHLKWAEQLLRRSSGLSDAEIEMMLRDLAISRNDCFIVITDEWVSLYSRDMLFESIASDAQSFARKISAPLLYTSNFDDDVFVFGLIHREETVISGQICDAPEIYDIATKTANMTALAQALSVDSDTPETMPTDISELEALLTSMIGVPLLAYEEDLCQNPKHFERYYALISSPAGVPLPVQQNNPHQGSDYDLIMERNGICVYRKISST